MLDAVNTVCKIYKCSPFEIMQNDVEAFINVFNYLIMKSDEEEAEKLASVGYNGDAVNDPLRMFI